MALESKHEEKSSLLSKSKLKKEIKVDVHNVVVNALSRKHALLTSMQV